MAAQENSSCISNAVAETDPNNAVGDAISNAVAQAFSKVIVCEEGVRSNPNDVSSLAISVAVAISESRAAGEKCIANADAAAEEVGKQVAGMVGSGLVDGAPGDQQKELAADWAEKNQGGVAQRVAEGEKKYSGPAVDANGCIDIRSILGASPTAAEVGALLEGAINEILTAVTCGSAPAETAEKKVTGAPAVVPPPSAVEGK